MKKDTKRNELTQPQNEYRRSSQKNKGATCIHARQVFVHTCVPMLVRSLCFAPSQAPDPRRANAIHKKRERPNTRKNSTTAMRTRKHNDNDHEENQTQHANPTTSKKTRGPPVYTPNRCLSIHVFPCFLLLSVLHLHKNA